MKDLPATRSKRNRKRKEVATRGPDHNRVHGRWLNSGLRHPVQRDTKLLEKRKRGQIYITWPTKKDLGQVLKILAG